MSELLRWLWSYRQAYDLTKGAPNEKPDSLAPYRRFRNQGKSRFHPTKAFRSPQQQRLKERHVTVPVTSIAEQQRPEIAQVTPATLRIEQ